MIDYLLMFAASFFGVFLLGIQSRNVNGGHYIAAVITSFGISASNFMFAKFAAVGDVLTFSICAAGGCTGIASAIWFYEHVVAPRRARQTRRNTARAPEMITIDIDDLNARLARYGIKK